MKIDFYISQLLYRYQCVTVPGFGAFLTEIQSAQIAENSNSFYPPKKNLSFNTYLKNNDGLLANHISQAEKITYDEAVVSIENQVVNWKERLDHYETIALKNIGQMALNLEKNLIFTPYNQVNYFTESFGLTSYVSPLIKREVLVQKIDESQEIEEINTKEAIETISINAPENEIRKNNFLKYAAIFAIGTGSILGLGYLGNQYYEKKIQEETVAIHTKVQKQVNQKIQEATFVIPNPLKDVTLTVTTNKMPYHIVAGVFSKEENAKKMYDELVHLGYHARLLDQNANGLRPVFYGSFTNYSEAEELLNKIKKSHNPDAWMLIEEK